MKKKLQFSKKTFFTHLGYSLNFTVVCPCQVMGAYLCLAELQWMKTRVPGVKYLVKKLELNKKERKKKERKKKSNISGNLFAVTDY